LANKGFIKVPPYSFSKKNSCLANRGGGFLPSWNFTVKAIRLFVILFSPKKIQYNIYVCPAHENIMIK